MTNKDGVRYDMAAAQQGIKTLMKTHNKANIMQAAMVKMMHNMFIKIV